MTKIYTASVIGAGSGGMLSIRALEASSRFELVAVADISESARRAVEENHPHVRTYSTYQSLLQESPTDIVCVSTWASSHLEIATAALELPLAGILVEKPLADNTRDGQALLDQIKAKNIPVAVPHGLLVSPHVQEIIARVHDGQIGNLRLIEIQCTGWDIINAGIHWLNFAVVLLKQDPVEVVMALCDTTTQTFRDGMQVETLAVTYAQTRSGVRIVMNTGDYVTLSEPDKNTLFRLVGSEGTIEFYGWESHYRLINGQFPKGETIEIDAGTRTRHQIHLDNLAEQMDRSEPDYRIAESSLRALEICEAAYLSSEHRCAVRLPLSAFVPPPTVDWHPGKAYGGQGGGRDGRKLPPKHS